MSTEQQRHAEKALDLKTANAPQRDWLERQEPTPGEGPTHMINPDAPVDGALDAEGHRPVLERSRKVR